MKHLLPALLLLAAAPALADAPGNLTAHHGRITSTAKPGQPSTGFLEIDNFSGVADTLTAINCPIATSSLIVGPGNTPIAELPVPAGKKLLLSAGGPHILLESTHFAIDPGGAIPCTLTFANAGDLLVYLYAPMH